MSIDGRTKAAARSGHTIFHHRGALWMFGGHDQLGAQVAYLLKLQPVQTTAGGSSFGCAVGDAEAETPAPLLHQHAVHEWVETDFSMRANRSRISMFDADAGRLIIMQVRRVCL